MQNIAAAIRAKNGGNSTYKPREMADAIRALPSPSTLVPKTITQNGSYSPVSENADGFSSVTVNVGRNLVHKSITRNGSFSAASDHVDGFSSVSVDVPNSYNALDEGKVVSGGSLSGQTSRTVTQNGTFDTTRNNQVTVNVSNDTTLVSKTITANGTYDPADDDADGFNSVSVAVPGGFDDVDEGKVVLNGALVPQTRRTVTANGTYNTINNNEVVVNVSGEDGYNQVGLLLHYDGIDNTGSGHDASSTTWKDLSGNGNDGTVHNGAWENDALIFDGTTFVDGNRYLWFGAFTMEFLVKQPVPNGSYHQFYTKRVDSYGIQFLTLGDGRYDIVLYNSEYTAQPTVAAGELFLLTVTYDMQTMKLYENGILNSTFTPGAINAMNSVVFNIGRYSRDNSSAGDYYTGKMKHVGIYSRALDSSDIYNNYRYLVKRFHMNEVGS